jgi:hypothetical protein
MKKLFLVLLLGASLSGFAQKKGTWTGYISDANCGAKAKDDSHADCAKKCVKEGAAPVLVVGKKVYKISDTSKVMDFVGQKVKVTGTIDGDTVTIEKVEA